MMTLDRRSLLAAGLALPAVRAHAAAAPARRAFDMVAVVEATAKALRDNYVDPDVANELAGLLLANLRSGAYAAIVLPNELAKRLTADIRARVDDQHLSVQYDPPVPHPAAAAEVMEDDLHSRFTGWGIQTAARLPGNVGLLKVTHFPSPPRAAHYGAAMELMRDTNALILDLTLNHGGGTDTTGYFLSYFLAPGIVIDRNFSRNEPPETIVTNADVAGPRYGTERPMFVAISHRTFSAGETIAARLRQRKRALLIGRQTRGGAHTGNFVKLPDGFQIFVVMGRSEDRDWEGIGVVPDRDVEPEFAVTVAHGLALETLIARETDPKTAQVLRNVRNHTIENLSSLNL